MRSETKRQCAPSEITDARINKLTNGNVWKVLLLYALPLFGSAFVQQLYSLVDLLVVGNFAANGALAVDAIGNATVFVNILLSFALGANNGCSVIIAKYHGKNEKKSLLETVSTAVISYSVLCLAIMVLGFALGRVGLIGLGVHSMYFDDCLYYLYVYIGSMPFVFLYNLGCGICAALGDSKTPFLFLVISSALNVGLDLLFVWGLNIGVAGAAWATFISQAISCVLTVFVVYRKIRAIKPIERPSKFNKSILRELTFASVPVIMQQSFVSVGNFFVNKCINGLDETGDAITGFTTAFKMITIATMSMVTMSGGLTNFASQNTAANKPERAKKGFWVILIYTIVAAVLFLALFVSLPEFFIRLFVQKDKLTLDALNYAVRFLSIVSLFLPVVGIKVVADGLVRGCGGNLGFAVSTFSDLILRVALVYILIGVGMGFDGVCWAWVIGWAIGTLIAVVFCAFSFRKIKKSSNAALPTDMSEIKQSECA
ncbi:MAG: MATE family efflux transporter [Clostridiales bacterium]|nr:MATE family efflux transporter [Clostridiales bacterium]